jgi:hypothetical protein
LPGKVNAVLIGNGYVILGRRYRGRLYFETVPDFWTRQKRSARGLTKKILRRAHAVLDAAPKKRRLRMIEGKDWLYL